MYVAPWGVVTDSGSNHYLLDRGGGAINDLVDSLLRLLSRADWLVMVLSVLAGRRVVFAVSAGVTAVAVWRFAWSRPRLWAGVGSVGIQSCCKNR